MRAKDTKNDNMMRVAMMMLAGTASAQQLNIPTVTDNESCDWAALPPTVRDIDELCCFEAAANPGSRCAEGVSCDVPCAERLLPFLSSCHPVIDKLFDADDGVEDGIAGQFDSVYSACLAISPTDALRALFDMHCSDTQLDGVAETPVGAPPCEDTRLGCEHLLASGFMTCAADFGPAGDMPGQCDITCGFCDGHAAAPATCDDTRDGCSSTIATGFASCEVDFCATCTMANQCDKTCHLCAGRHRLQSAMQCDLTNFAADAQTVDVSCCDDGVSCAAGVPTTCDAKCAVMFVPFFDRCETILSTQVDHNSFDSYQRLYDTCATGLPVEPLLRAAAVCAAGPAGPTMMYVAGGFDGSDLDTAERYDPSADTWAPLAPMSGARRSFAAVAM